MGYPSKPMNVSATVIATRGAWGHAHAWRDVPTLAGRRAYGLRANPVACGSDSACRNNWSRRTTTWWMRGSVLLSMRDQA